MGRVQVVPTWTAGAAETVIMLIPESARIVQGGDVRNAAPGIFTRVRESTRVILSRTQQWNELYADSSGDAFAAAVSPDVRLDGSIFTRTVHGRHTVWTVLRTAASVYDSISFTHEASAGHRTYLEWNATAVGLRMEGATILVTDVQGRIAAISVHHRPLVAVLAFSAEMGKRLAPGAATDWFYQVT